MKALTIWEPWASLVALGEKEIETRCWATKYRGKIAIHAAKKIDAENLNEAWKEPIYAALKPQHNIVDGKPSITYHPGCVIAIANLVDCVEMTHENIKQLTNKERAFGWYEVGRYMWLLNDVKRIRPIPQKGGQRIWNWEYEGTVVPL
jgi:hypothetical protein